MLVEVSKINKQEVTVVSSLDVAETFEKRHDHQVIAEKSNESSTHATQ